MDDVTDPYPSSAKKNPQELTRKIRRKKAPVNIKKRFAKKGYGGRWSRRTRINPFGRIRMRGVVEGLNEIEGLNGIEGLNVKRGMSTAEISWKWRKLQELREEMRNTPYYIPEDHQGSDDDDEEFVPVDKHKDVVDIALGEEAGIHPQLSQRGKKKCTRARRKFISDRVQFHTNLALPKPSLTAPFLPMESKLNIAPRCLKGRKMCRGKTLQKLFLPSSASREKIALNGNRKANETGYATATIQQLQRKFLQKLKQQLEQQIQQQLFHQQKQLQKLQNQQLLQAQTQQRQQELQEQLQQLIEQQTRQKEDEKLQQQLLQIQQKQQQQQQMEAIVRDDSAEEVMNLNLNRDDVTIEPTNVQNEGEPPHIEMQAKQNGDAPERTIEKKQVVRTKKKSSNLKKKKQGKKKKKKLAKHKKKSIHKRPKTSKRSHSGSGSQNPMKNIITQMAPYVEKTCVNLPKSADDKKFTITVVDPETGLEKNYGCYPRQHYDADSRKKSQLLDKYGFPLRNESNVDSGEIVKNYKFYPRQNLDLWFGPKGEETSTSTPNNRSPVKQCSFKIMSEYQSQNKAARHCGYYESQNNPINIPSKACKCHKNETMSIDDNDEIENDITDDVDNVENGEKVDDVGDDVCGNDVHIHTTENGRTYSHLHKTIVI